MLTAEQRAFEELSLMLRTPRGVPWGTLDRSRSWTGSSSDTRGRAVLTVRGRLLANEVTDQITSGSLHG